MDYYETTATATPAAPADKQKAAVTAFAAVIVFAPLTGLSVGVAVRAFLWAAGLGG